MSEEHRKLHDDEGEGEGCPACGAPAGMPHDHGCPMDPPEGVDPDSEWDSRGDMAESYEFDKFMDTICEREDKLKERKTDVSQDTPARVYQKRYKEYHNNRIVYRRGQ